MLVGGLVLGLVVGLACRVPVVRTARSRAQVAGERLRGSVAEVAHELVVDPVEIELAAYAAVRTGVDRALG
jgi:hypothetical protein